MKPEERGPEDVQTLISQRVREETLACIEVVRKYLVFDSQRAVSYHEVQDCLNELYKRT